MTTAWRVERVSNGLACAASDRRWTLDYPLALYVGSLAIALASLMREDHGHPGAEGLRPSVSAIWPTSTDAATRQRARASNAFHPKAALLRLRVHEGLDVLWREDVPSVRPHASPTRAWGISERHPPRGKHEGRLQSARAGADSALGGGS